MNLQDVIENLVAFKVKHGNIDLGNTDKVSICTSWEGWCCGWGTRHVFTGLEWSSADRCLPHRIGTELFSRRIHGASTEPLLDERDMSAPVVREVSE